MDIISAAAAGSEVDYAAASPSSSIASEDSDSPMLLTKELPAAAAAATADVTGESSGEGDEIQDKRTPVNNIGEILRRAC